MSRRQLVDAYVGGRISRRVFIKKLVKAGVTVGAAVTFASVLTPAAAQHPHHDHYHHYHHPTPPDPHHPPHHEPPTHPTDAHHVTSTAQSVIDEAFRRISR